MSCRRCKAHVPDEFCAECEARFEHEQNMDDQHEHGRPYALKSCSACGVDKPLNEFHRHSSTRDGLKTYCKECARAYQREYNARRREEFFADKRCVDCGRTNGEGLERLELDRLDPETKVNSNVWMWPEERRAEEVAKCEVRCRRCHMERHAALLRKHGPGGYNRGCRCEICKAASRDRRRRQYAAKREQAA